ncbi:FAD-binding domain-containing protein, partial [Clavulina sp. PMI_390]
MFRLPLRLRTASVRTGNARRTSLAASTRAATRAQFSTSRQAARSLTASDVEHFATILPKSSILSTLAPINNATVDDLVPFNNDWMGKYFGKSQCVLKPSSAEQVSQILKWCNEHEIAVVPQGGNTGLVGGGVPVRDEVILNLSNMNQVRSFDPLSGVLVADAGCILENLTNYLAPHKHIMPLDLGAKGSCHIGGNVATNAGGLRLLRYGSLHGSVLGLEVVLPDGSIMSELSGLRKDNTGYDLKQLFIGSEGTLGIITGVSILTPPAPSASSNMLLALPSFDSMGPVFKKTKEHLSEVLSAFEYFDRQAYDLVCHHTGRPALDADEVGDSQAFVLIETSGGKREHDEAVRKIPF